MKALSALCSSGGASTVPAIANGRVTSRHSTSSSTANGHHRASSDSENAEIQMYLSKLKDLVPFMPKNRKLSKLEVIQYVIDYICDLQTALETHPAAQSPTPFEDFLNNNSFMMDASKLRQPLGVRQSPNQIVDATPLSSSSSSTSNNTTVSGDPVFRQHVMSNNADKMAEQRKSSVSSPSAPSSSSC